MDIHSCTFIVVAQDIHLSHKIVQKYKRALFDQEAKTEPFRQKKAVDQGLDIRLHDKHLKGIYKYSAKKRHNPTGHHRYFLSPASKLRKSLVGEQILALFSPFEDSELWHTATRTMCAIDDQKWADTLCRLMRRWDFDLTAGLSCHPNMHYSPQLLAAESLDRVFCCSSLPQIDNTVNIKLFFRPAVEHKPFLWGTADSR